VARRSTDPEQLCLFVDPETPPVAPGKPVPPSSAKITWSKYRPKEPPKCDDCMHALAAAKGNAPASRRAKFRRAQGGSVLLLCYFHAQLRRESDGMSALE